MLGKTDSFMFFIHLAISVFFKSFVASVCSIDYVYLLKEFHSTLIGINKYEIAFTFRLHLY